MKRANFQLNDYTVYSTVAHYTAGFIDRGSGGEGGGEWGGLQNLEAVDLHQESTILRQLHLEIPRLIYFLRGMSHEIGEACTQFYWID